MKLVVPLTFPAVVGFFSWALAWAFAVAPLRRATYASEAQTAFGLVFAVMTWIGPLAAILAVLAIYKSSLALPSRRGLYLLNGAWGIISLVILIHFAVAHWA
jgi:hypothetical protein